LHLLFLMLQIQDQSLPVLLAFYFDLLEPFRFNRPLFLRQ
jgi:hypothetical protein